MDSERPAALSRGLVMGSCVWPLAVHRPMSVYMIATNAPMVLRHLSDRAAYSRTRDEQYAIEGEYAGLFRFPRRNGAGRHKHHSRDDLWNHHGGICYLCQQPVGFDEFHIEHVVPISRGGADEWDNLNVAHGSCNLRKGSRLVSELDWVAQ